MIREWIRSFKQWRKTRKLTNDIEKAWKENSQGMTMQDRIKRYKESQK